MLEADTKKIIKTMHEAKQLLLEQQFEKCIQKIEQNLRNLSKDPKHLAMGYRLQGEAHHYLIQDELAIIAYNKALEIYPYDDESYSLLAKSYVNIYQYSEAIEIYKQVITLNPRNENHYLNLAALYQHTGQLGLAKNCYQEMLKLNPHNLMAYRNMGLCLNYVADPQNHKAQILNLLSQSPLKPEEAIQGHFALGKIYLDQNRKHQAFTHFQEGNAIKSAQQKSDLQYYLQGAKELRQLFTPALMKSYPCESSWQKPIFIIGLSRAGKTLVEQLIAQHSTAVAGGELTLFEKIMKITTRQYGKTHFYPDVVKTLDPASLSSLRAFYLQQLNHVDKNANIHVIDTTPSNYRHLGLISLLFPGANIIHCVRHPLDHCLQIYFKYFGHGNAYSYSLRQIAHYYLSYQQLMKYWAEILPMNILEVRYEELILKPEDTTKKIFNYLKLPWRNDLLTPAMKDQQSLHANEMGLWKEFADYLDICQEILNQGGGLENYHFDGAYDFNVSSFPCC